MKKIALTQGLVALIDDEDLVTAGHLNWYAGRNRKLWYAQRNITTPEGKRITQSLHRFILRPADDEIVDHIDGDGLNCQRANMRIATARQSTLNRVMPQGMNGSGFRGVHEGKPGRWIVHIRDGKEKRYLGSFDTPEKAARVYDEAAKILHGEFAVLNFP